MCHLDNLLKEINQSQIYPMQQYIEYIYKHAQHGTSSKRGSKIDFSNPKFRHYFSFHPIPSHHSATIYIFIPIPLG